MSYASFSLALFTHINLLLALYAGAALATAARFKWDPSTYIVLRDLFSAEYHASAGVLCFAGVTQLLLVHLATVARDARRAVRRVLLFVYAFTMLVLMLVEGVWCIWMACRIVTSLQSPEADNMMMIGEKFKNILYFIGDFHPVPQKLKALIQEAEADVPKNVYAVVVAAALLVLLQPMALALAMTLSCRAKPSQTVPHAPKARPETPPTGAVSPTNTNMDTEPWKITFKSGRLNNPSQAQSTPSTPRPVVRKYSLFFNQQGSK